jgi:hypothetical protein
VPLMVEMSVVMLVHEMELPSVLQMERT